MIEYVYQADYSNFWNLFFTPSSFIFNNFFFYFYFVMLLYLTKPLSYYRKVLNIRHKHNCFMYIDKKNVIHFVNQ